MIAQFLYLTAAAAPFWFAQAMVRTWRWAQNSRPRRSRAINLLASPPSEFARQQLRELKAGMRHTVIVLAALASIPFSGFIISLRSANALPQGLWLGLSGFCVLISIGSGLRLVHLLKQRKACLLRFHQETTATEQMETLAPEHERSVTSMGLDWFNGPLFAEHISVEPEQGRLLPAPPYQSSRAARRRRSIPDARSGRSCHKAGAGKIHPHFPRHLLPKIRLSR
ncbi:MAG TPA: hypothetical protein VH598_03615 [Verrucomicrobiae bacterium]|nr:hypothetical protein [Verrucomicrobiae bacterium]